MNTRGQKRGTTRGAAARDTRGFTLIELMTVISVITIIAAIAIPNLLRSKITTNEGAAIANMRTISSAEIQYKAAGLTLDATGTGTFATLNQLQSATPAFVDSAMGSGTRQGYKFTVVPGGAPGTPNYTANADPVMMGSSGTRGFFVNESGVITFRAGGVAGPTDYPVQ